MPPVPPSLWSSWSAIESNIERVRASFGTPRDEALLRMVRDTEARLRVLETQLAGFLKQPLQSLPEYRAAIDRFNAGQPNRELLDAIRGYNHQVIDSLDRSVGLSRRVLLDVGASPHGYALERALELGVAGYAGVGLDVSAHTVVQGPAGVGELVRGDAEALPFGADSFDAIVTMSTFEHIQRVDRALAEMHRVVRPGGAVLVTFEPLWTCSYGHHLHHFGDVSRLVPPWAHLWWSKEEMRDALAPVWPAEAPLTLAQALAWVYDEPGLNRVGIRQMATLLRASPLDVEWMHALRDDRPIEAGVLRAAQQRTDLTADELLTKGFSVMLRRRA
jgi:SAM-dependent methyltransferase